MSLSKISFVNQVGGSSTFEVVSEGHIKKDIKGNEAYFFLNKPHRLDQITPRGCIIMVDNQHHVSSEACQNCRRSAEQGTLPVQKKTYVIMEDMTQKMVNPIILDLKLGNRQYGDTAGPEKIALMIARCAASTSAVWAVRVGGCRMNGEEITKQDGRTMTYKQMEALILSVFATDALKQKGIKLLKEIELVLEEADSLRLFGASMLIIVDQSEIVSIDEKIKIKLIDFDKATHPSFVENSNHLGPDAGAILGVQTVIDILRQQ